MSEVARFRDIDELTAIVRVLLVVSVGVGAVGLWAGWAEIALITRIIEGEIVSAAEIDTSETLQAAVGVIYLLVFIGTGIAFLRWTHRYCNNAHSLASGLTFTPGWSVGWYFVPIATFWKPYQALEEAAKASDPKFDDDWKDARRPDIMAVWWGLWLLATFVSRAVTRMTIWADTPQAYLESSQVMFVSDLLDIPLAIVAMLLVSRLHLAQAEKHRMLALLDRQEP